MSKDEWVGYEEYIEEWARQKERTAIVDWLRNTYAHYWGLANIIERG